MSKEHLDLLTAMARLRVFGRGGNRSCDVLRILMNVARYLAHRHVRAAALLEVAGITVGFPGPVDISMEETHTGLGRRADATTQEMAEAQAGRSTDPRTAAALGFAVKVVDTRGHVSSADIVELRNVGFEGEDIVEIMAHIALNLFTNYLNVALDVPVSLSSHNSINADVRLVSYARYSSNDRYFDGAHQKIRCGGINHLSQGRFAAQLAFWERPPYPWRRRRPFRQGIAAVPRRLRTY